ELRDRHRWCTRDSRTVALDAEQEVRRHQDRLDADRETFFERSFLRFGQADQVDVLLDLDLCDWPAERAGRQIGDDPRPALALVDAVEVTAGVDLLEANPGRTGRLVVRAANVQRVDTHAVQRNLLQLRGGVVERLAELRHALGSRAYRRPEFTRRRP